MLHFTPVNRVPLRLEAHFVDNALAIDAAGNLYISDARNNRIRKVIGIAAPGLIAGQ